MAIIVFDAGGTLMEYKGMPGSWIDYYYYGFNNIAKHTKKTITMDMIEKSIQVMKDFNPRINYRELEYSPEYIFGVALSHWDIDFSLISAINDFFDGINLSVEIYSDAIPAIQKLKLNGHTIAMLTDLPTAMPDKLFKKDIAPLLKHIDCYVSSQSCGYRKPNIFGLQQIAAKYRVPICELIFVGDEEKDKITAQNAGCHFIQINRAEDKINTLKDLKNIHNIIY